MGKIIIKKYNTLISAIISLLGFASACEMAVDEYGVPAPEYGVPYGEYEVNGTITNESDEKLKNIQVTMGTDTVYSDSDGKFSVVEQNEAATTNSYILKFRDIDGIENGEYSDLDTTITINYSDLQGGDGWYQGKAEKTIEVKMKEKK